MQRELAEVYKALFLFLLKVAEWFNKSSVSRFFDSINKAIKQEHEEAVAVINRSIDIMTEKAGVEKLAAIEYIRRTNDIIEWKVDQLNEATVPFMAAMKTNMETLVDEVRMQGHIESQQNLVDLGKQMVSLLLEQSKGQIREMIGMLSLSLLCSQKVRRLTKTDQDLRTRGIFEDIEGKPHLNNRHINENDAQNQAKLSITRAEADLQCKILRALVYGTDGIALAQARQAPSADVHILTNIGRWIKRGIEGPQRLWVQYPFESQESTSAKMTALGIIWVAARANAPFISYICTKPRRADIATSQSVEGAGLLSMAYSLILQLLRYRLEDDEFKADPDLIQGLGGSMGSWERALRLLSSLLDKTPILRYCIIHGLNELESGDSAERCKEFLSILRLAGFRQGAPLSVLLTTSGQSRVLASATTREERVSSSATLREVNRHGQNFQGLRIEK